MPPAIHAGWSPGLSVSLGSKQITSNIYKDDDDDVLDYILQHVPHYDIGNQGGSRVFYGYRISTCNFHIFKLTIISHRLLLH